MPWSYNKTKEDRAILLLEGIHLHIFLLPTALIVLWLQRAVSFTLCALSLKPVCICNVTEVAAYALAESFFLARES